MVMDLHGPRSILTPTNVREFKVVVIGPRKVGKSALVVRFLTKRFINEYLENTDMSCNGVADVDGEALRVNVQDTSEKAMRTSSVEHYFRWAEAIMLVYSITDAVGFRQLKDTVTRIVDKVNELDDKEASRVPPMVLVGNKSDRDYVRRVTREEGFELAEKLHCDFFECSAREGWSKLITKTKCTHSGQETLNVAATAATAIGMGLFASAPQSPSQRRTSEMHWRESAMKMRGHSRSRSVGVSAMVDGAAAIPTINVSNKSDSGTPSQSEEESDDNKKHFGYLGIPKTKLSFRSNSFIGKLSPRLGRKFSKTVESHLAKKESMLKRSSVDRGDRKRNGIASGLARSLAASAALTPESMCPEISCDPPSSSGTSTAGSTESLTSCGLESDRRDTIALQLTVHNNNNLPACGGKEGKLNGRIHLRCNPQLQDQEFVAWEPFIQLCRDGRQQRNRVRSRSPSNLLRSGFKRIRSLAAEPSSNHNQHHIHKAQQSSPSIAITKS